MSEVFILTMTFVRQHPLSPCPCRQASRDVHLAHQASQPLPNTAPTVPHHPILFTSHKSHKPCRNQILAVRRFQNKMFWSPLSEIHIRHDLLFSSSSKGKKINFYLYHKYNNDYIFYTFTWGQVDPLLNVLENSWQLTFTGSRHSHVDPSFYVIIELS